MAVHLSTNIAADTKRKITRIADRLGLSKVRYAGKVIDRAVDELHRRLEAEAAIYGEPEQEKVKGA